jgi:hypothetical protein
VHLREREGELVAPRVARALGLVRAETHIVVRLDLDDVREKVSPGEREVLDDEI